ncbi:MAG: hypothetical protein M5U28_15695 [Sandaracinaceae bacterium]|nr:hypothetical protein [Sandaracinaceae bacterium]
MTKLRTHCSSSSAPSTLNSATSSIKKSCGTARSRGGVEAMRPASARTRSMSSAPRSAAAGCGIAESGRTTRLRSAPVRKRSKMGESSPRRRRSMPASTSPSTSRTRRSPRCPTTKTCRRVSPSAPRRSRAATMRRCESSSRAARTT